MPSIRSNWFEYEIKTANGRVFYTLQDLCADIVVDCYGDIEEVDGIFTEEGKVTVYLDPKHPLYAEISDYVVENRDGELVPDDWDEQLAPDEHDRAEDDLWLGD